MTGFITIERKLWDHPLFKPEPMTEREAWMWMIAQAAWAGTRHRVGGELLDVPRGSFMATLRDMQGVFMWGSDKRVRTFLKKLEKDGMIGRTTVGTKNAPKTHVTICNYDEYQTIGRTKDAPETHERTHHGRTTDAVKKPSNHINQEKDTNVSLSEQPPAIDDAAQAIQHFNAIAAAANWPTVQKLTVPRRAALRGRFKDIGGLDNWCEAITRASRSSLLTGNNNRGWTADFDWLAKPANFTKLMEGNYDDRTDRNPSPAGTHHPRAGRPHDNLMAGFAHVADQNR